MRFIAEEYGPQTRIDIELGEMITLLVGRNNTGKTFASRAIYAILKSCRGGKCDADRLATLLINSNLASKHDLWLISKNFSGKLNIELEDEESEFKVKINYDKNRDEPLIVEIQGDIKNLSSLYAPAYRIVSLGFPYMFASYAIEFRNIMLKLASQIVSTLETGDESSGFTAKLPYTEFDSDLLHVLINSVLSALRPVLIQRYDVSKAATTLLAPTLLDLAIAIQVAERQGVCEELKNAFIELFPEFPYKALGFYRGKTDTTEIQPHLLSSGMIQTLPLLCILNLALVHAHQGYERIIVLIDEPEINLELSRQIRLSEAIMDFIHSLRKRGKRISAIIATHSDFITYSITKWLARNDLRNLAKVYEFEPEGIMERDIDESGEVKLKTFSEAVRRLFFEEF